MSMMSTFINASEKMDREFNNYSMKINIKFELCSFINGFCFNNNISIEVNKSCKDAIEDLVDNYEEESNDNEHFITKFEACKFVEAVKYHIEESFYSKSAAI